MASIILAPHPDDEWIGCGCTILKKLDEHEQIRVLILTKAPHSIKRLSVSSYLAKKYRYALSTLGEKERKIDENRLLHFLNKHVKKGDVLYVPDYDIHPDHRSVFSAVKNNFKNKMFQYCVYNNSLNPMRRIINKVYALLTGDALSSFRRGKPDFIFTYKLEAKNANVVKFGEVKRGGDVLRRLN